MKNVGSEAQKRELQKQKDRKIKDFKDSYKEKLRDFLEQINLRMLGRVSKLKTNNT